MISPMIGVNLARMGMKITLPRQAISLDGPIRKVAESDTAGIQFVIDKKGRYPSNEDPM